MRLCHFCDAARCIGIITFDGGKVAGKQLSGDNAHQRSQPFGNLRRELDRRLSQRERIRIIRDDDKFGISVVCAGGSASPSSNHALCLWRNGKDRESAFDHRNGTMLKISGGIRLGDDVG